MRRDDLTCRRLAVQLACQLLEDKDDCLRVLEHVRTLIEFTTDGDAALKAKTVVQLKPM